MVAAKSPPSALDELLNKKVQNGAGTQMPTRSAVRFIGCSVTDNEDNDSTDVTPSGAAGAGQANLTLANGLNSNVGTDGTLFQRIGGPTGAYSLGGIVPAPGAFAGKPLTVSDTTGQALTIVHEDTSSTAAYRIHTPGGLPYNVTPGGGAFELRYDSSIARWVLTTPMPPPMSSSWRRGAPGRASWDLAMNIIADSVAGRFAFARSFCAKAEELAGLAYGTLLAHFGQCAGNAATPYLLKTGLASLAQAQAAFPLSTAAGDLDSGTYNTNSLDWAVINESIRYSEANGMCTVWLDHPGSQISYGIIGTFVIKGGVRIRGQGSWGDNYILGTTLMFFTNNADGLKWIGTADPSGVGNFGSGTGGGMDDITIVKANRAGFGGSSYTGGRAIVLEAQSAAKRPGVMAFTNVYVLTEVYGGGSSWLNALVADGSAVTTQGTPGVRDCTFTGCRFSSCSDTHKNVWLKYVEHFTFNGCIVDTGLASGGHPGITIEGDSADIHFAPLLAYAESLDIADSNIVNVSNVSQANPAIVTTSTPHGYTTASGTAQVQINGLVGGFAIENVNGFVGWATIIDSTHFSIPVDTTAGAAYSSGGTVRSASPQDITVVGRMVAVNVTALSASGFVQPSVGQVSPSQTWSMAGQPAVVPGKASYASASPWMRFDGNGKPGFQLENFNNTIANVTGDNTPYVVSWNNTNWDYNREFGGTRPSTTFTCAVAGTYKFRVKLLLNNVTSSGATLLELALLVTYTTSAGPQTRSYRLRAGPKADATGFQTLQLDSVVQLAQGDTVEVQLNASGGTKTIGIFGDSGAGWSTWDGEIN